jgi:outer membrane protein insertion porin family
MLLFFLSTGLAGAQERPHPDLPAARFARRDLTVAAGAEVQRGETPSRSPAGGEGEAFGKTVVSVAYTSDGPVDPEEVSRLIEVRAGRPLTDDATSSTIRNLFATRQFSDIRIEARDEPGGVAVTVNLFRSYRVKPLKFSSAPVSRAELRRVAGFPEGSTYQAEAVAQGVAAIKRRLAEEGYLQARVTPEVSLNPATFDARVLYRIEAGKPARAAAPFFDGKIEPYTAPLLEKRLRLKPGDRYRESKAKADAARLTEFLHKQTRLKGTVELIAAQPTEEGRVMPVYRITVGPEVLFESKGIKPKTVRSQVHAMLEGQVFDEDLVLQYVEQKRKDLQGSGYYRAKVDYLMTQKTPEEPLIVTIVVDQGAKYRIEKIAFAGNRSVKEKDLLAIMVTRRKGLPLLRPGHLVDDELTGDVSSILGYYQTRGWINAKVDKPQVTDGSKPGRLVVTVPILEGPRAVVADLRVEGAEHAGEAAAEKNLLVKRGAFYNPYQVRQDVFNLQTWYHDHGWREAAVKDQVSVSADGSRAEIAYRVEEGERTFFGKTIVRGNARTQTARVTRLLAWKEGRPFSEAEILETQRNLSRTGVFRRVDLRPQPADPKTQARNVEIDLQEGRPLSLLYGIGYQLAPDAQENRNDPFAIGGVSYNNLFGRMESAGFEAQYAPLSGRGRIQLSFREPFLFNRNLPLTVVSFYTREPIQQVDIRRLGTVVESSRFYGKYLRLAMRYEYQRITPVNSEDLSNIEKENFPRFDRPIEESTIGPNMFYDRRDDVVDPHGGYYVTAGYKYAFPILSARARYHKLSGQAGRFWKVGDSVLAVALRTGAIWPYGPSDIQVPIAERFFAGGRSTNRAFDTDLLGVPGSTVDYNAQATPHTGAGDGSCATGSRVFPELTAWDCDFGPRIVGGNGFLSFNAELRIPIYGGFGATVFYDASQVWRDVSQIRFALEGDDGLRQGVGIGLRYMTPIGPVRVEYGWPVSARTITYNATTTDAGGNTVILDCSGHPCAATTKEKGRFFVSIGYPF